MKKTIKDLLIEMSEKELQQLLFPENEYKPLWRWTQSTAGRLTIPNYSNMSWADRALTFSEIAGWTLDEGSLRVTFTRFDASKTRMKQMFYPKS